MSFPVDRVASFDIAGIGGRTSNAREGAGQGIIGALWTRVRTQAALEPLGARDAPELFALYSGYERDAMGAYDFTIGLRVGPETPVPPGFVRRTVEANRYARVITERGPAGRVVFAAWQRVWSATAEELGGLRAFRTDFERYPSSALTGGEEPATLFVGLR